MNSSFVRHLVRAGCQTLPLLAALAVAASASASSSKPLYLDSKQSIETRVDDLLGRLTLEEKVSLCHANANFSSTGITNLGIPELWMDDGPLGVRAETGEGFRSANRTDDFATAMPSGVGLAATWDPTLAKEYGAVIGAEAKLRGKNIMLGPSLNIQRTPLCGRNHEYMGEDPFLTSRIAVGYILGEQSQGVASCAKHFALNNQENQRNSINVLADERTVHEIYLPAFKAAVQEAGVLSIMGAYNKFRGEYCCENDYLLNKVLKDEWGFKGLVMSDWGGTHTTMGAALHGLDLEMGSGAPYNRNRLGDAFLGAIKSNQVPMSVLDDKVRRHLYVMFKLNMIQAPTEMKPYKSSGKSPTTKEHQQTARKIAEQTMVLLKNEGGVLPLEAKKLKTIAVIGANANATFAGGGDSAQIKAPYEITALEGISNKAGANVKVTFAPGFTFPSRGGRGGRGAGRGGAAGAAPTNVPAAPSAEQLAAEAVQAAKAADVVIYVGGFNHQTGDSEGGDRRDLKMPGEQDALLAQIVAANPKTVVVLNGGAGFEMGDWLTKAPSVLFAWYGGLENGNALANVLFGEVNPSGKLPCTFPKRLEDTPAAALNAYPQTSTNQAAGGGGRGGFGGGFGASNDEEYKEGLLVGYRWYDTKKVEPLFPFGFGLSYTSFKYSNMKLQLRNPNMFSEGPSPSVKVTFTVENTGKVAGSEVAEIYVREVKPTVERPEKELKGFAKIALKPGKKQTVTIELPVTAFSFYNPDKKAWVANKGDFEIQVGGSSRDLPLKEICTLPKMIVTRD